MPGRHTLRGYNGCILAVFGVLRGTHTCLVLVPMHPHTPLAGLSSIGQKADLVLGGGGVPPILLLPRVLR